MSVRVDKRNESKVQYVYTAMQIYKATLGFLRRVPSSWSRLISNGIINEADELYGYCAKADSVYYNDEVRLALREEYLLRARGACDALIAKISVAFEAMLDDPNGTYLKADGAEAYPAPDARVKLNKRWQELGDLLNTESAALTKLLKNLKNRAPDEGTRGCDSE